MISNRAAFVATCIAFVVGVIGSLSLRSTEGVRPHQANHAGEAVRIRWRVPTTSSSTLPVIGDNTQYIESAILQASNGALELQMFEPGEIVPAFAVTDAVRDGKVSAGYTWLGYDQGKTAASALLGAVPFGMEPWEYTAWWFEAGGRELGEELYLSYNVHPIYCGMTGPETAGWFRQPLESLDDLSGLKIRFAGIGGKVLQRLGASVTMLPSGEIFQALEKGAIDASEFALPIVDEALGFSRVAKYNYYPGWHQPFTASHLIVNLDVWNTLSGADQSLVTMTCTSAVTRNMAKAEALQGAVIAGFESIGVSARVLPMPLLRELQRVTDEVLEEEAGKDPMFARILESQRKFRAEYGHWKRLAYLPRDF
ncbi:MAG TPA: TRAP transporter substrate-binding protein [Gammaproteobacteria bacterium]|nr:TRAP transporter substrate-binding protein [Gammaproteobacteria bacterium]HIL98264.1 TRAP transporter substrate-binding protein [Pseudomonadales bacterium]